MKIFSAVIILIWLVSFCCNDPSLLKKPSLLAGERSNYMIVDGIKPPEGFIRVESSRDSFGEWLRNISLKKENIVYLYNGVRKQNQTAQFAVLNISVGKKNLQQCADAVMRLRAEFLFDKMRFSEIEFRDNNDKSYWYKGKTNKELFHRYLETVFGWCGSASLEKQLQSVADPQDIQAGDVFIKGGFPGHAMIVIDVAVNKKKEKVFMLAQSYMPAQDIHIVNNPMDKKLSPWYSLNDTRLLHTPEWTFSQNQLRRW